MTQIYHINPQYGATNPFTALDQQWHFESYLKYVSRFKTDLRLTGLQMFHVLNTELKKTYETFLIMKWIASNLPVALHQHFLDLRQFPLRLEEASVYAFVRRSSWRHRDWWCHRDYFHPPPSFLSSRETGWQTSPSPLWVANMLLWMPLLLLLSEVVELGLRFPALELHKLVLKKIYCSNYTTQWLFEIGGVLFLYCKFYGQTWRNLI